MGHPVVGRLPGSDAFREIDVELDLGWPVSAQARMRPVADPAPDVAVDLFAGVLSAPGPVGELSRAS